MIDLCTRKLVGYAMAEHMRAELVVNAITMAATHNQLAGGAIFHSDSKYVRCQVSPGFVTRTPIDPKGYRGVGGVLAAS